MKATKIYLIIKSKDKRIVAELASFDLNLPNTLPEELNFQFGYRFLNTPIGGTLKFFKNKHYMFGSFQGKQKRKAKSSWAKFVEKRIK